MVKKKKLYITATTDLPTILNVLEINDVLKEKIQLENYGTGLKEVVFNAIILSKLSQIHQTSCFFDGEKKSLTGSLVFDYSTLENSATEKGKKLIIRGLLSFIKGHSSKIQSFDFIRFQKDILQAFEMTGTIE